MNKEGVKIVTIGGGSSYTPELMEGFIKRSGYVISKMVKKNLKS